MRNCFSKVIVILALVLATPAFAQTITGSVTSDNSYQVWIGDVNGVDPAGQPVREEVNPSNKSEIEAGETFTFDYAPRCHIYLVSWSDDGVLQGAIGSFVSSAGGQALLTGDSDIEVLSAGMALGTGTEADGTFPNLADNVTPTATQINDAIAAGTWVQPFVGPKHSGDPNLAPMDVFNLNIPGLDPDARWIWYDSGNDARPVWPAANTGEGVPFIGFNHGEFLIFRVPCDDIVTNPPPPPPPPNCCQPVCCECASQCGGCSNGCGHGGHGDKEHMPFIWMLFGGILVQIFFVLPLLIMLMGRRRG